MRSIVWGGASLPVLNEAICRFVAARIPNMRGFGACTTMGVVENEILIAGIVYHNYAPEAQLIEMSGAASTSRWMSKPVLRAMFHYPFAEVGCQMVLARHSERNVSLRRIWAALGAEEYLIPRARGRNEAEAVATLTDDAWRSSKILRA